MITSERTFQIAVPESDANFLTSSWDKFKQYYECFIFVKELKRMYDDSKKGLEHVSGKPTEDKIFCDAVTEVFRAMGERRCSYPGSSVLKALSMQGEPERFNSDYQDTDYKQRDIIDSIIHHATGRN